MLALERCNIQYVSRNQRTDQGDGHRKRARERDRDRERAKVGLTEIWTKNRGRSRFSSRSVHISRYFISVDCTVLIISVPT